VPDRRDPEGAVRRDLVHPEGWEFLDRTTIGPFLTAVRYRLPDGREVVWTSRRHRRGLDALVPGRRRILHSGVTFRPRSRNWWISVLFMVGALLFALGAVPAYARAVGDDIDLMTFFIGSLFFTAAAYLQFLQAINAPHTIADRYLTHSRWFHVFTIEPRRIDWWATSVQFVGTIFFNVSTFDATREAFEVPGQDVLVWIPTVVGSICFLVASYAAILEVWPQGRWRPGEIDWWIVMINMAGSIFFMASAIGAFVVPDGDVFADNLVIGGTFLGGLCFFVGALLLAPEAAETTADQAGGVSR
jgi:hypothetical protein